MFLYKNKYKKLLIFFKANKLKIFVKNSKDLQTYKKKCLKINNTAKCKLN